MKTVVKMQFGSHLYGTATPSSDTDLKSVHIPDASDILLQQVEDEIVVGGRQKAEGEKNTSSDVDDKSYSLQKFLNLAAEGQTVAIDMLFAPQEMIEESSGWWRYLVQNRYKLLSKKSTAFLGYCRQQANKYGIKGSRVAAAKDASEIFSSMAAPGSGRLFTVGECPNSINLLLSRHPEHCAIVEQSIGSSGQIGKFLDCCGRKVSFTAPVKRAAEIYTRIYENYGDRARLAQSNEGVDWKALSHAVRVGYEAVELLRTGNVTLPLPNAAHVLDIKLGRLPYQEVSEEIEHLLEEVEQAAATSHLPDEPDHEFIRHCVLSAYGNAIYREHLITPGNPWRFEIYGSRPMIDPLIERIPANVQLHD